MHATNTNNPIDFPVTQQEKNVALAKELLDQVADLVGDFVRDNLDQSLDMDDLIEQYDTVMDYITKNMKEAL